LSCQNVHQKKNPDLRIKAKIVQHSNSTLIVRNLRKMARFWKI